MGLKLKTLLVVAVVALGSAQAVPTQWTVESGGNGHFYEFYPEPVRFDVAFNIASSTTFDGRQGYLATATSAAENSLVSNLAGGSVA